MTVVSVVVLIVMTTTAASEIEVAYIDSGAIATGTHDAAVVPSGNVQPVITGSISTGIAPDRYMQCSTCGVDGMQSASLKLALLMMPPASTTCSATTLFMFVASPVSTWPLPLMSVYGSGSENTYVAPAGAVAVNGMTRFGPPAAPLPSIPSSGSKLAASPSVRPQTSPVSHVELVPEFNVKRYVVPTVHGTSGTNATERSRTSNVPGTGATHAPVLSSCSTRTLPALHVVPSTSVPGFGGCVNTASTCWSAASVNGS